MEALPLGRGLRAERLNLRTKGDKKRRGNTRNLPTTEISIPDFPPSGGQEGTETTAAAVCD